METPPAKYQSVDHDDFPGPNTSGDREKVGPKRDALVPCDQSYASDDEITIALAEAIFRAGFSNPSGDGVDRAWFAYSQVCGYREAMIRNELRGLGYDVVRLDDDDGEETRAARAALAAADAAAGEARPRWLAPAAYNAGYEDGLCDARSGDKSAICTLPVGHDGDHEYEPAATAALSLLDPAPSAEAAGQEALVSDDPI